MASDGVDAPPVGIAMCHIGGVVYAERGKGRPLHRLPSSRVASVFTVRRRRRLRCRSVGRVAHEVFELAGGMAIIGVGRWGGDSDLCPRRDSALQRVGTGMPDAMTGLRSDASAVILFECDVPALGELRCERTLPRESVRQFYATTIVSLVLAGLREENL